MGVFGRMILLLWIFDYRLLAIQRKEIIPNLNYLLDWWYHWR